MKHQTFLSKMLGVGGITVLSLGFIGIALAAYAPKTRNTCALSVHPYNTAANNTKDQVTAFDTQWFNIFQSDSPNCTDHLQYPNQYNPQPPLEKDTPLATTAGIENKSAPETQHDHAYFNDSVEDDNFYYKAFIKKFQITLKDDALNNVKTNLIVCKTPTTTTPVPMLGCNGHQDVWGGTDISFDAKSGVVTWTFGTNSPEDMPVIYGNNKDLNWVPQMPDTTNDLNRVFEPAVLMASKDNSAKAKIWSATTVSRVLLSDQAILKTSVKGGAPNYGNLLNVGACKNDGQIGNIPDYTQWCTLPLPTTSNISGVEGYEPVKLTDTYSKTFYWFKIGVVGTVWRTPTKIAACTGLTLTPTDIKANTPVTFHVTPTFANGTVPLDYEWQSSEVGLNKAQNQPASGFGKNDLFTDVMNLPPLNASNTVTQTQNLKGLPSQGKQASGGGVTPQGNAAGQGSNALANGSGKQNASGNVATPQGAAAAQGLQNLANPVNNGKQNASGNVPTPAGLAAGKGVNTLASGSNSNATLGLFADDDKATDFANPYTDTGSYRNGVYIDDRDTYYTGGNPSSPDYGIAINVIGINKNTGTAEPDCQASTIIYYAPPTLSCKNITATFIPQPFNPTGSTQITAKVTLKNTQTGEDVVYPGNIHWTTKPGSSGNFTFNQQKGNPLDTATQSGTSTVSYSGGQNNTAVTIAPSDPAYASDPNCQITIQPGNVPPKVCSNLTIYRNNVSYHNASLKLGDPTDNLTVVPVKDPGLTLAYQWKGSVDNGATLKGNFTSASGNTTLGPANPLGMPNESFKTNYTGADGQKVTTVHVDAYDVNDPNKATVCSDQFNILPPGGPVNACLNLNPKVNGSAVPNNGYQFQAGQTYLLSNNPANVQNPAPPSVLWAESGSGYFTPAGNDPTCNNPAQNAFNAPHESNTTFTAPAYCTYNYTAAAGGLVHTEAVDPSDQSIPDACKANYTVSGGVCQQLVVVQQSPNRYCVQTINPSTLLPQVQWNITNGTLSVDNDNRCVTVTSSGDNSTLVAQVPGAGNQCYQAFPIPKKPPQIPHIEKDVSIHNQYNYKATVSVSSTEQVVDYRLTFTPGDPNTTATITDPIAQGIGGVLYPGKVPGGSITYNDNMQVSVPQCVNANAQNCYTGDIGNPNGLTLVGVSQPVTITYQGLLHTQITPDSCETGHYCEEKFVNQAVIVSSHTTDSQNHIINLPTPIYSNLATVQIFCQYILTRAAGDVYLETDLGLGIDINICSNYKGNVGPIVVPLPPAPPSISKEGQGQVFQFGHEVCKGTDLPTDLQKYYGDPTKLSSTICQVKLTPNSTWDKNAVNTSIEESKTRLSRWEPNLQSDQINNVSNLPPSSNGVYRRSGSLTIDAGNQPFINDGDGAKTFIVENGDLVIKNNINIGPCKNAPCTFRETASLAFIVLNGNIYVDPGVTNLSGVYFVQKGNDGTGYLYSGTRNKEAVSTKQLFISGSIYGDIGPLLKKRIYTGDPAKNEGSIVIRFDLRIMNTPPGLQDLLDVKSTEVAN